jgi:hypothetical protein
LQFSTSFEKFPLSSIYSQASAIPSLTCSVLVVPSKSSLFCCGFQFFGFICGVEAFGATEFLFCTKGLLIPSKSYYANFGFLSMQPIDSAKEKKE